MIHQSSFFRLRYIVQTPAIAILAGVMGALSCEGEALDFSAPPLPAGSATNRTLLGRHSFSMPISSIDDELRRQFLNGRTMFVQAWVEAPASTQARDGLGPLFNARSCIACHPKNGRGSPVIANGELGVSLLFRLSRSQQGPLGAPTPDPVYGGQLQPHAVGTIPPEAFVKREWIEDANAPGGVKPKYILSDWRYGAPADDLQISPRIGPALAGLGLLEAIDEKDILAAADPEDANGDGISGKAQWVQHVGMSKPALGRFGWKAEMPDLRYQIATAFHEDVGITSPIYPEQACQPAQKACLEAPDGGQPELNEYFLQASDSYMQLLAVPLAKAPVSNRAWWQGLDLFHQTGCAKCHTPRWVTRPDAKYKELSGIEIWPYTDMLLHDMGPLLSDNRPSFAANAQEWRTPPLWGIGRYRELNGHQWLMHDGRADGVASAIAWHGGEGKAAKDRFFALDPAQQQELVSFVESL